MAREVKLNEIEDVLEELSYPASKGDVERGLGDVTLQYADGEEPLMDIVGRIDDDEFDSPEDLQTEIFNRLPTEAVGEPGQSEGEG